MAGLVDLRQIEGLADFSQSIADSSNLSSSLSEDIISQSRIENIKGAFISFDTFSDLEEHPINKISNNQIVWVNSLTQSYQATIIPPDFVTTFEDTVEWNVFDEFGGGITDITFGDGLSGSILSGTANIYLDTGSLHFIQGVQKVTIDGGEI